MRTFNGIHLVFVISKIPVFVIFFLCLSYSLLVPSLFSSFLSLTYNRRRLGFVGHIINTCTVTIIIMRWRYNMSINMSPSTQGSHINKRSASISAFGASFFIFEFSYFRLCVVVKCFQRIVVVLFLFYYWLACM
jgi:hypothetical protein